MALFDLPLRELREYRPQIEEPADFDAFWTATLAAVRETPLAPVFSPVETGLALIETFDVTFQGWDGQPIKAWLQLPRQRNGRLPCVVEFIGYGGGRGLPVDWLLYASAGCAHFVMDTRGQGSAWRPGDTPDAEPGGGNPQYPGFMTRGIEHRDSYYYRRLFADAVRAVETARASTEIDPTRIAVAGGSQGGGICLAVAGLSLDVAAVLPDNPFLCHYRRATEITDAHPYAEIAHYLRVHHARIDDAFETLSYFDGVSFAARATAPALFAVGLMDPITPPSTIFAAFNAYRGEKQIEIYPYGGHEGGGGAQSTARLDFLRRLWART